MSLRDEILGAKEADLKLQPVVVPGWGKTVYLRGWSAKEREVFENEFGDFDAAGSNIRARVLVRCIRDEAGSLVFQDSDADALGEKLAGPIGYLFGKVRKMSGLIHEDLETARKN